MKIASVLLLALCGLAPLAQAQEIKGNAAKGGKINDTCIGCHGIPGYQASFPEVHRVPAIAGQNPQYIVAALNAYRKGERKQGSMRAIAGTLSDQDIADLAAYYATLHQPKAAADGGVPQPSPAVAELLTKGACASCHGANFSKPIDGSYPKIAGQFADYLYVALKAYKTEGNPVVGRSNAIMAAQVKQFSNKELRLLAEYLGSLPPEIATVAQSPFR
jgi:cytochrome c553